MKNKKNYLIVVGIFSLIMLSFSFNIGVINLSSYAKADEEPTFNLQLAHSLSEDHPVHIAITNFADKVEKETNGNVNINIHANGILGTEREVLEQIQNGIIDMAKVSASTLENFGDLYSVFSMPYIFNSKEHFYNVMDSNIVNKIFNSTADKGFIGITWFDSGARSFYTADTPINTPKDLKGLKIRTMDTASSIEMMKCFNGSATILPYGDIYTGLQQGIIDGAENNPTALTLGLHAEVAKYYSFDEHTRIPDILVISSSVWNKMSQNQRDIIIKTANETKENFKKTWAKSVEESLKKAKNNYDVKFIYPEKSPFKNAVQPMYDKLRKNKPEVYKIAKEIMNYGK